jgi:hypothetical protein
MNKNGKIVLIPTSGLANRIRILATAIKLADESGKNLLVYWESDNGLRAEFKDLFKSFKGVEVQKIPLRYKLWLLMARYSSKIFGLDNLYLRLFNFGFIFRDSMATLVWHNKINIQKEVNKAEKVFICSCQEINYFNLDDYHFFKPQPYIQKKIDQITANFKQEVIGIHIRSTDNTESIKNSPFELFIKKIEEELKSNPFVSFFLATDNENYQNLVLEKFGRDKIIFQAKEFRRDATDGIIDAVVDLYCLSKTSKIYGSYFSSFSTVAGRIGQIPVQVLTEKIRAK